MKPTLNRRHFIHQASVLGAAAALGSPGRVRAARGPNDKIVVGVMGLSRGMAHVANYLALPNVEIAYVCDVDSQRVDKALATIAQKQGRVPQGVRDFRRILDDRNVDALSVAAPNFWHTPATVLACAAGKHVYVEKPGSHNAREGELIVAAARKHQRVVQMGNQRRSWAWTREAIAKVHAGEIGRVTFARAWYNADRPTIGRGRPAAVPAWLDYSLWQGPAPERPYVDNLVHYNWHWRWHWGGGELANNGIHALDLVRWGLGVDCPRRVSCSGGRYQFQDDQETPDVYVTAFDFGDKGATWESHSCHPRGFEGVGFGVNFYGDKGHLVIAGNTYKIFDLNGKEQFSGSSKYSDADHFANFLDGIRTGAPQNSEIAEGQKSTLLCHLGNLAYRTGHTLDIDPRTRRIINDKGATALWGREYRKGWEPKV